VLTAVALGTSVGVLAADDAQLVAARLGSVIVAIGMLPGLSGRIIPIGTRRLADAPASVASSTARKPARTSCQRSYTHHAVGTMREVPLGMIRPERPFRSRVFDFVPEPEPD
jgi:hypothetical protein